MSCIINILEIKKKKKKKKKDANSEAVTHLRRKIYVKIFSNSNPLKVFTKNCKNLQKYGKTKFYFSVKFINNIFDNFNDICYCFLLSGAVIESHTEK